MKRMRIAYTISEDEQDKELVRLLKAAEDYLEDMSSGIRTCTALVEADNYEGCLKSIAQLRDSLASADYRLHDTMNLIVSFIQHKAESNPTVPPPPAEEDPTPATDEPGDLSKVKDFQSRAQQIKNNIELLGLDVTDEELQDLMRKADDKVS